MSKGTNSKQFIQFMLFGVMILIISSIAYYYSSSLNNAPITIAMNLDDTMPISVDDHHNSDISSLSSAHNINITNSIIKEHDQSECIPSDQNISFLPSYDDPQTQIIRTIKLRHKTPPLLISFGGSGNTFIRVLIEYVTKIYTGSIYNHEFINQGFIGSGTEYCITKTIVVKVHGDHIMRPRRRSIDDMYKTVNLFIAGKCLCGCMGASNNSVTIQQFENIHGKIINPSAIFIIRNPWDAFFALYQYWTPTWSNTHIRHAKHIELTIFNLTHFRQKINQMVRRWNMNMAVLRKMEQAHIPLLVIKFENVVSQSVNVRSIELWKIIRFLYRNEYLDVNQDVFKHRIDCIWKILDIDRRMNSFHRSKPNTKQLNKTYAYQLLGDKSICRFWRRMMHNAESFGYGSYNDIKC